MCTVTRDAFRLRRRLGTDRLRRELGAVMVADAGREETGTKPGDRMSPLRVPLSDFVTWSAVAMMFTAPTMTDRTLITLLIRYAYLKKTAVAD